MIDFCHMNPVKKMILGTFKLHHARHAKDDSSFRLILNRVRNTLDPFLDSLETLGQLAM